MIDAISLTESRQAERGFYPTPDHVAYKMLEGVNWDLIQDVLEPSAGKGDLAEIAAKAMDRNRYGGDSFQKAKIDCIELDENLRHILKGKGFRVVHDDFERLTGERRQTWRSRTPKVMTATKRVWSSRIKAIHPMKLQRNSA